MISVGIRDVVRVGPERDTTWTLGCRAGGGGRARYSGRRIRGHWDRRGVHWVLRPWDGRQLWNEEGCTVSWWVSHSLGSDASTGSEGLRVGITYEDNRERVDYISTHHFRARS